MSKAKGEGRSASEKSGRFVVPAHVRKAERDAARRQDAEWAAKSGPVEVRKIGES